MAEQHEQSESGAPVHRYQAQERDFELAIGDEQSIEQISAHIEKHVGPVAEVFHELVSDLVHIDVHIVNPTADRNYYTLITSGMSDRPMHAPAKFPDLQYAELMLCLPPSWKLDQQSFKDDRNYWPIRMLKVLARFPHEYQTWLWASHTVPTGDPPTPFAENTDLCCALLLIPALFEESFQTLKLSKKKTIHFLSVVPLYREEMDFKLKKGLDPLIDRLDSAGVTELLDIQRKNVCKKRFGFF